MKCLTLCFLLVWGAAAAEQSQLAVAFTLPYKGRGIAIQAQFAPLNLKGGTVAFSLEGETVPGCEAVPVEGAIVYCEPRFTHIGRYRIGAKYSGTADFLPSHSEQYSTIPVLDPWSYIAMIPPEPIYGQGLFMNALILGAKGMTDPTGTFTFYEGGRKLVERAVGPDGHAEFGLPLDAGWHTITAVYNGDSNYLPSGPASIRFRVVKGPPIVAISATPAQLDQPTVVTAAVTARNPTGTITFAGIPSCRNIPLDENGFAHCQTTYTQLGDMTVIAQYSGDANLEPASAVLRLTVGKAVPGLYVAIAPGTPVYGQPVRISALAMGAPGIVPPVGALVFTDELGRGESAAVDSEGRGSWSATFPVGKRRVFVQYPGDVHYAGVQASTTFEVDRAATTMTLTPTAGGYTAKVAVVPPAIGTPTGTVRFFRDGTLIGTPALQGGTATLATAQTGVIVAEYPGDANCYGTMSTAASALPRAQVTLSADRNPAKPSDTVIFTAEVAASPGTTMPTGSVQFTSDGTALGTVALSAGRAMLSTKLGAGAHAIAAAYSGDSIYAAAAATLTEVVTGTAAALGLSPSVISAVFGQPVTFTAQLAVAGTGTVGFADGATPLGTAALSGGAASFTVATLAPGAHTITATYAGDASYAAASAELAYVVGKAPTTTAMTLGTGAASVKVDAAPPGAGAPSGSVRFVDALSGATLATATLAERTAVAVLGPVKGPVAAVYDGDEYFQASASSAASAVVVVNGGSYTGDAVAADEIVSLFGPLPAGITSAEVTDRAGEKRPARVLFSAAGQAAIVLPAEVATGKAVLTAGGYSALVTVATAAPGIFTADASGKGPPAGVADEIAIGDEGAALVLYGTGFRHAQAVTSSVGEVLYAGAQSEFPGLDQVNLRLPVSMRGAGAVVVVLTADGVAANAVTLRVR